MTTVLALIVVLGVLIFVHELGHFLAAKAVDIEVERFSIGLGPRIWGFTWGETEYILSAIPLGGYVKMGGMDDEMMEAIEGGSNEPKREPSPRDYDSKPIWARTFVISAGVIMNMIFAFVVYSITNFTQEMPNTTRIGLVDEALLPANTFNPTDLPVGSEIVSIGGEEVAHWGEVQRELLDAPSGSLNIALVNPTATVRINVPDDFEARARMIGSILPGFEPVVGLVEPGSPAEAAGLQLDDQLVAVDGIPATGWIELTGLIRTRAGTETEFRVIRDGRELSVMITPEERVEVDPATGRSVPYGRIGIGQPAEVRYSVGFFEAIKLGAQETWSWTMIIVGFVIDLFTGGISPRAVGSIFTIGEASGQAAALGMGVFFEFMAFFSVNLAVLNLLPIPVLDGGHLLFLGIEAVRGRALSVKQRLRWSQVGFVLLMGLMIWALGNDILRMFGI